MRGGFVHCLTKNIKIPKHEHKREQSRKNLLTVIFNLQWRSSPLLF
ncbi:hypothetical protein KsCSTR_48390 [Candidatus Kuenenia stuttgartiensis]|uniref:Uncharacterized protein n=1 Tax=Kuenenia stuttgartiensis TaxID=174633 RepID=A0A6G7GXB5_KUEST|nr:hypothetical protein KsCSTR_48390 [Candidatus Kuenenia stuttgartiensis]